MPQDPRQVAFPKCLGQYQSLERIYSPPRCHCKENAHFAVKVLICFLKKARSTSIVKSNIAKLVIWVTKVHEMSFQIMLLIKQNLLVYYILYRWAPTSCSNTPGHVGVGRIVNRESGPALIPTGITLGTLHSLQVSDFFLFIRHSTGNIYLKTHFVLK